MRNILKKIGAIVYFAAIIVATILFTIRDADRNLKKEVVIEAGSEIRIEEFFNDCPKDARFVSDISVIDTNVPAVYKLTVHFDDAFEKDVILKIEDHTAPKGIALPKSHYVGCKWPDASECVGYLYDLSGIAKIEYQNGEPDFKYTGDYEVPVAVTDWYNNTSVINVPFHVIDDHNAPVFYGIHDFKVDCSLDTKIDYLAGISWKDDYDEDPIVIVDDSKVKLGEVGNYTITYIAKDAAGNIYKQNAVVTVMIPDIADTFTAEGGAWDTPYHNEVYEFAMTLVDELRGETDIETARNIFSWVHSNVFYESTNEFQTFEGAVYQAFTKHSADCYGYYATCRILLDCAGISNMMVLRYPVIYNGHYWNLVKLDGEWYHCDSTVFMNHPSLYFMQNDWQINDSRHSFNGSILPERAEGSSEYTY